MIARTLIIGYILLSTEQDISMKANSSNSTNVQFEKRIFNKKFMLVYKIHNECVM